MALLNLDAAIKVQPDLADAYLVRTQVYAAQGNVDASIENLEKYIELTEDTSLYETVAQLNEAKGDIEAAQAAYDKYVAGGKTADVHEERRPVYPVYLREMHMEWKRKSS